MIVRPSRFNRPFNLVNTSTIISVFIHTFELTKQRHLYGLVLSFKYLKQPGFSLLPITTGSTLSPAALTKNVYVPRCFAFSSQTSFSRFRKTFFWKCFRELAGLVHIPHIFRHISLCQLLTCSCKLLSVASLTSPSSPAILISLILYLFFHFSSHPFEP